ncbi:MAG: DUF2203 domain-containing protein [Kastovskya adunca ATA6-11-RM4]|jgi:hypothetical protein|nr:DUF2203 domain-containing protein [Kastovskya adunca ATA6-11-RM4]
MKTPQEPSEPSATSSDPHLNEADIEQAIAAAERSLIDLKERFAQIQRDQQRQNELQQRQKQIKKEQRLPISQRQPLKAELKRIKTELETIELNLESRLFSWGSLKEPFWQAVRFGGLGIVIGWLLRSCGG